MDGIQPLVSSTHPVSWRMTITSPFISSITGLDINLIPTIGLNRIFSKLIKEDSQLLPPSPLQLDSLLRALRASTGNRWRLCLVKHKIGVGRTWATFWIIYQPIFPTSCCDQWLLSFLFHAALPNTYPEVDLIAMRVSSQIEHGIGLGSLGQCDWIRELS